MRTNPRIFAILGAIVAACGSDRAPAQASGRWPLEIAIESGLAQRFGQSASVHCTLLAVAPGCEAELADHTRLAVRLAADGHAWTWHVDGRYLDTAPVVAYVQAEVNALGLAETASCGARVQKLAAGERLACTLSGGGRAFVDVGADGTLSVELALGSAAAGVRGEAITPARAKELDDKSHALEHAGDMDEP